MVTKCESLNSKGMQSKNVWKRLDFSEIENLFKYKWEGEIGQSLIFIDEVIGFFLNMVVVVNHKGFAIWKGENHF